ncbi:MAG: putative major facilitator superfamily transporter [Bacteroidetes bacterium]|nr:putative major facilitator superfamily transporter [Bacteroidota bacterium]
MQQTKLPLKILVIYGIGCFGWSIGLNIISVLLNYIYTPPTNSGMQDLIPNVIWFGYINIISIILFTGRGFDAIMDPLIANFSDKLKSKLGRRIPLMRVAFLPLSVFCVLVFLPLHRHDSHANIYWLAGMQLVFYFFFGLYTIPYNALLADIGHDARSKIDLSTAQSVGFMAGALVSSASTVVVRIILYTGVTVDRLSAYQYAIIGLNVIAMICLAIPAFGIDEKKYAAKVKSTGSVFHSLMTALRNPNFRIFALADASYFMAIAIISTGLLYYIRSMLRLDESLGTAFMLGMVVITLLFYGVVNRMGTRYSKKTMMIISFAAAALVFGEVFFLGHLPIHPIIQASVLVITFGIPNAFLQILPSTVIADIAHDERDRTGRNEEGMFFGMRALFQKIGQTAGLTVFAMLTIFGKDPGHDWGLRLSGLVGAGLCAFSSIIYMRYSEK